MGILGAGVSAGGWGMTRPVPVGYPQKRPEAHFQECALVPGKEKSQWLRGRFRIELPLLQFLPHSFPMGLGRRNGSEGFCHRTVCMLRGLWLVLPGLLSQAPGSLQFQWEAGLAFVWLLFWLLAVPLLIWVSMGWETE